MDQAFTEASSRLQRVRNLPNEADRPRIFRSGGGNSNDSLIFLFLQRLPNATIEPENLRQFVVDRILPRLEAIEGVGGADINQIVGEKRIEVEIDPFAIAPLGISVDQISQNINRSSDVTGGRIGVGRRDYVLRFQGRYDLEKLKNLIIVWRDDAPVTLGSIADIRYAPAANSSRIVYQNGNPALGIRVLRQPGSNALAAITEVKELIKTLNEDTLPQYGLQIEKALIHPFLFNGPWRFYPEICSSA